MVKNLLHNDSKAPLYDDIHIQVYRPIRERGL